jgi:hypothetical protein
MEYQVIKEWVAQEQFDDYIDEATDVVKILGMSYTPSRILKELDPIAYDLVFDEFANHLWEDGTAIEGYNDDDITECDECGIYTDDSRGELCKDCDKQADEERGLR